MLADQLGLLIARHAPRSVAVAGCAGGNGLELHCANVGSAALRFAPVDLIYAALIFEYVDAAAALAALRRNLRAGGVLATLVQLPAAGHSSISASPYRSLAALSGSMRLIAPADLGRAAAAAGFVLDDSRAIGLASGKRFHLQVFAARR
jgi:hypothetical protein